jgi:nicotinamidase-related amidase
MLSTKVNTGWKGQLRNINSRQAFANMPSTAPRPETQSAVHDLPAVRNQQPQCSPVNKPLSQNDQSIQPIESAVHLCIDMQRIFATGGIWETPWMERVLPTIAGIVDRYAERTVFTRFITPNSPAEAAGQWRRYFQRWEIATRQVLAASQLELVPELARFVPPATVIDKPAYSAFYRSPLADFLQQKHVRTVIVSGAETDVCVLSTVLDAVNIGFRVVIVEDALCSSSDVGHDALMTMYRTRFNEQIDLVKGECLRDIWADA